MLVRLRWPMRQIETRRLPSSRMHQSTTTKSGCPDTSASYVNCPVMPEELKEIIQRAQTTIEQMKHASQRAQKLASQAERLISDLKARQGKDKKARNT